MQNDFFITGGAILLCLLVSAFFSASETAITAVSRARIYHLILEGNRRAKQIGELRKHKERLIGGIMIGNNTVNILASALATGLAIRTWGAGGVFYATIIMTAVVVIFAEVLPKTYSIQNAETAALRLAPAISAVLKLLTPLSISLQFIIRHMLKLFGVDITHSRSLFSASDVIRGTIELHHHEGQVVKQDRDMLGSILDMHEISVCDIMVHRLTIETINIDLPAEQIITIAVRNTHSRIPIWQGNQDNIIGVLHVKTLIRYLREGSGKLDNNTIRRIMVKPWFIPDTTAIKHQLHAFRARRQHLAMVVDEYGALQGLVTLEDIIEIIVGRIDDEHDKTPAKELVAAGENAWFVKGSMNIRDMNRELGWDLPDDEAATVGGLVIHEAQKIPDIGEEFSFHHVHFTILDKKQNLITRLKVEKPATPVDAATVGNL